MAKVSFNGVNREIVVLPGIDSIDVQIDLYSEWKRWLQISDNAKYPAAFRTFGGDPTIANQFAPRYFFLINNWEIVATSVSVAIQTNLYSDSGDTGIIIDNAAVAVRNSDAVVVNSTYEESLVYNGKIYIDTRLTESGQLFPYGTIAQPVNNLTDAIAISDIYNIDNYIVRGDMIFDQDVPNSNFIGGEFSPTIIFTDVNVSNSVFEGFYTTGEIVVNDGENVRFEDCGLSDLNGVNGLLTNCVIQGDISMGNNTQPRYLLMSNCVSGQAGLSNPDIIVPHGTYSSTASGTASIETMTSNLNIRNYSGGIGLSGSFGTGSFATFELDPGMIHLYPSISGGEIVIRGVGELDNQIDIDTFDGTIVTDGFYYDIEQTTQGNAYNGEITIDVIDGFSGSIYPIGTGTKPVNNISDAIILSNKYNIHTIKLDSDIELTGDLSGYSFYSSRFPPSVYINGATLSNSSFDQVSLYGTVSASSVTDQMVVENSIIGNLSNFYGIISNSGLNGELQLGVNSTVTISDSKSLIPGIDSPIISKYNGSTASVSFNMRAYSGGIRLKDWNNPNDITTLEFIAGNANIDPSVQDGLVVIRGVGSLNNESGTSSNVTLITDGYTSNLNDHLERMEPELFRIGDVSDQTLDAVLNISGATGSDVYDLLTVMAGTVSLIYSDTQELVTDVDYLVTKIDEQYQLLVQIAGLSQKNYRMFDQVYDANGCLLSASIKTYPTSLDADNDTNPDFSYEMSAEYDTEGRLIDYKVIEI